MARGFLLALALGLKKKRARENKKHGDFSRILAQVVVLADDRRREAELAKLHPVARLAPKADPASPPHLLVCGTGAAPEFYIRRPGYYWDVFDAGWSASPLQAADVVCGMCVGHNVTIARQPAEEAILAAVDDIERFRPRGKGAKPKEAASKTKLNAVIVGPAGHSWPHTWQSFDVTGRKVEQYEAEPGARFDGMLRFRLLNWSVTGGFPLLLIRPFWHAAETVLQPRAPAHACEAATPMPAPSTVAAAILSALHETRAGG
jgi:hypothetical protein